MTTKQDIRNIQCQQVNAIENKLRYIAENVEEIVVALRIKQAQELEAYAQTPNDRHHAYDLWRGSAIDFWVFANGCKKVKEAIRGEEE